MKDDVEAFEMDPHGVGWIGEASMSQRVRQKQVTELVMNCGHRDRQDGQQDRAKRQCQKAH